MVVIPITIQELVLENCWCYMITLESPTDLAARRKIFAELKKQIALVARFF